MHDEALDGLTPEDTMLTRAEIAAHEAEVSAACLDGTTMLVDDDDTGRETIHFDEGEGNVTIARVVDHESVLDWCKGRYNAGLAHAHCEMRQIASIPPEVLDFWGALKFKGLPPNWYLKKEYHNLVLAAAHDGDLAGFRTLAGSYVRREDRA